MNENIQGGLVSLDLGDSANQERLQHLFRYAQVGRCVNGVAHDINNHLGAAMAYSELVLMEDGVSEDAQQMVEKILTAVDKCGKLVSTLTGVARPLGNSANMVDLNALLRGVLLLRDYAFRAAKIEVTTDFADDLPSTVGDGPKLQLAVLYLLLNVEEYFQDTQEEKKLSIRSYRDDSGLFIEVKNSGAEIPSAVAADMFSLYTSSKQEQNLGMGLARARSLVQEQQGDITYEGERGFLLRLPMFGA